MSKRNRQRSPTTSTNPKNSPFPEFSTRLYAKEHRRLSRLSAQTIAGFKPMAHSTGDNITRKLIQIDVTSDTVCPWCFVGKKNLEKAMDLKKDQYDFEVLCLFFLALKMVRWHPYFLNPSAPKEGVRKSEMYKQKFGSDQYERIISRMTQVFQGIGFEYDTSGLTGNTLDSHRLLTLAAHQGYDKQNALVEELFINYFSQGKYIGDRQVLLDAARKVGVEGAAEFLDDPNKGLEEVNEELDKYANRARGVPHFVINGKHNINGGQPPEVFLRAIEVAANDNIV